MHLPPARVSFAGGNVDDMEPLPMADATGTVITFTIDRLAYSPSPPVVFAVVDFDGGGRLPIELTDTTPDEVTIGGRVEMTFRRLNTADGIAQLLLEGTSRPLRTTTIERNHHGHHTGSRTRSPSSGWAARRSASTGTRAPMTC